MTWLRRELNWRTGCLSVSLATAASVPSFSRGRRVAAVRYSDSPTAARASAWSTYSVTLIALPSFSARTLA
jgi:hypothetical protein